MARQLTKRGQNNANFRRRCAHTPRTRKLTEICIDAVFSQVVGKYSSMIEHFCRHSQEIGRYIGLVPKLTRRSCSGPSVASPMDPLTLKSGQEEIERMKQRNKEAAEALDLATSSTRTSRNNSVDSIRSPYTARTPTLRNVSEEDGTFAIGDDDDSDNEGPEAVAISIHSSPSGYTSRTASVSSSGGEPLPTQMRGMSEKACSKMPAGQTSFSRQNSITSLSSNAATILSPSPGGFDPTA